MKLGIKIVTGTVALVCALTAPALAQAAAFVPKPLLLQATASPDSTFRVVVLGTRGTSAAIARPPGASAGKATRATLREGQGIERAPDVLVRRCRHRQPDRLADHRAVRTSGRPVDHA